MVADGGSVVVDGGSVVVDGSLVGSRRQARARGRRRRQSAVERLPGDPQQELPASTTGRVTGCGWCSFFAGAKAEAKARAKAEPGTVSGNISSSGASKEIETGKSTGSRWVVCCLAACHDRPIGSARDNATNRHGT